MHVPGATIALNIVDHPSVNTGSETILSQFRLYDNTDGQDADSLLFVPSRNAYDRYRFSCRPLFCPVRFLTTPLKGCVDVDTCNLSART